MDFFATKGIEYLLVIGYLLVLIPFWWLLRRSATNVGAPSMRGQLRPLAAPSWFDVPDGLHFHRGHTWAVPEYGGVFRVGLDDFAQKLLGRPEEVLLPSCGERLEQGEPGWRVRVDGRTVPLLSPVRGEVVAVNQDAVRSPGVVCEDPYGRGWLLKVRVAPSTTALKNLLPSRLARVWTEETAARLNALTGRDLGLVLQDGGLPASGFGRHVAGERWQEVAAELLLTRIEH